MGRDWGLFLLPWGAAAAPAWGAAVPAPPAVVISLVVPSAPAR